MQWRLMIEVGAQYGEVPVEAGRPGRIERGLLRAVIEELFGSSACNAQAVLREKARQFGAAAMQLAEARSVLVPWTELLGLLTQSASPPLAELDAELPWQEILYGMCLHALCSSLAAGGAAPDRARGNSGAEAPAGDDTDVDSEPSEIDLDEEIARLVELIDRSQTPQLAMECYAHDVRWKIARRLESLKFGPGRGLSSSGYLLIAEVLLEALFLNAPTSLGIVREPVEIQSDEGEVRTVYRLSATAPGISVRVDALLKQLPFRLTLQPLRVPPVYRPEYAVREQTDSSGAQDADYGALIGYRRTNEFLRQFHREVITNPDFVRAVNAQQAVAWRINRSLLDVVLTLAGLVYPREQWVERTVVAVQAAGLVEEDLPPLQGWVRKKLYSQLRSEGERRVYSKPGDFLEHILAREALGHLIGGEGQDPPTFYLPWKADYRGRITARTPWLTPQGADSQRALLEFAVGEPLDEDGQRALRRYGGSLAARRRILKDLEIRDRYVLTLAEREQWIKLHESDILASASNPLANEFWRKSASKPLQFLAFCMAYSASKSDPSAPIHLPVQIDGTCNGFQHIAALTGVEALARAVNVLPRPDDLPGDLYVEVALAAEKVASNRDGVSICRESGEAAEFKRRINQAVAPLFKALDPPRWLDRDLAKKVVMTVPYGAGSAAQAENLLLELAARLEETVRADETISHALNDGLRDLGKVVIELTRWSIEQSADEDRNRKKRDVLDRKFAYARRALRPRPSHTGLVLSADEEELPWFARLHRNAYAGADRPSKGRLVETTDQGEWFGATALAALLADWCVEAIRKALKQKYPVAERFEKSLKAYGQRCKDLPLAWSTPLGLPVCLDKFKQRTTSINARLRGRRGVQDYSVGVIEMLEVVKPNEQVRALLPNLIHSLDATHLMLTINRLGELGVDRFGSIHDCVLCHPNQADIVGVALRETFAKLYAPTPDGRPTPWVTWTNWMDLLASLRQASQYQLLYAALDMPNPGNESKLDTAGKIALNNLRALKDPVQIAIARSLVRYLMDHPLSQSESERPARSPVEGDGFGKGFDVGGVKDSPYFFH